MSGCSRSTERIKKAEGLIFQHSLRTRESMHSDAIGAIAELLEAIGVIASLVYLAAQVRQNTSTVRSSAAASLGDSLFSLNTFLAQEDVNRL